MKQPKPPETVWLWSKGLDPQLGDKLSWFDYRVKATRLGTVVEVDGSRVKLEFES